jgi:hypothetical protein
VTDFLFKYLESKSAFEVLQGLYDSVKDSFKLLGATERTGIGFARIFARGSEMLTLESSIISFMKKSPSTFIEEIVPACAEGMMKGLEMVDSDEPILESKEKHIWQIIEVKPDRAELVKLAAQTFHRDVLELGHGWHAPIVRRYLFVTRTPLPSCGSIVEVEKCTIIEFLKEEYFADKLTTFCSKVKTTIRNIEAVLPPVTRMKLWAQSVAGLGISPLVKFMQRILVASPETKPYYSFVKDVLMGTAIEDSPPRIHGLVAEIHNLFVRIINLSQYLSGMSTPTQEDNDILETYCGFLGLTLGRTP